MSSTNPQGSQGSTAVAVVVVVLIIGAVATLGYYQFAIAPSQLKSTTTSSSSQATVTCPSAACVNVTTVNGAASSPPGFTPDTVTVVIGVNNTVFWTNADNTGTPHTVTPTSNYASWPTTSGSPILSQGQTYQWTFTVPGTYDYYCTLHPTVMKGTVIVLAGTSSTATRSSSATTTSPSPTTTP